MARKTSAERQAAYRRSREEAGENGERRLNTWVTTTAFLGLARLARHHGTTSRAILEKLIGAADDEIFAQIADNPAAFDAYLAGSTTPRRSRKSPAASS